MYFLHYVPNRKAKTAVWIHQSGEDGKGGKANWTPELHEGLGTGTRLNSGPRNSQSALPCVCGAGWDQATDGVPQWPCVHPLIAM